MRLYSYSHPTIPSEPNIQFPYFCTDIPPAFRLFVFRHNKTSAGKTLIVGCSDDISRNTAVLQITEFPDSIANFWAKAAPEKQVVLLSSEKCLEHQTYVKITNLSWSCYRLISSIILTQCTWNGAEKIQVIYSKMFSLSVCTLKNFHNSTEIFVLPIHCLQDVFNFCSLYMKREWLSLSSFSGTFIQIWMGSVFLMLKNALVLTLSL